MLAALGNAGCGGDDDDNLDRFVGAWNYTSGTVTAQCPDQPARIGKLEGTVSLNKGTSSPLVWVDDGCILALDVDGNRATVRSGQQCKRTAKSSSITTTFGAYTFTVNGAVADVGGSATTTLSSGTVTLDCTYAYAGALIRVSK